MESILTVRNLQKKFGSLQAVNNLSFEVMKKEIFGLLGPNGAGKTTTITMLCGLQKPSSGFISMQGSTGELPKSRIGYCPQENIFYPRLTCFEQLCFVGRLYNLPEAIVTSRAHQILNRLGLAEKSNSMASALSGGMKRRLNIALAIIHDPELLILDEPEAGLDPQSRLLVREFIRQFGTEKTVILTTHNMDEADRLADRILIMDHGEKLMLDTPDNLKNSVGDGDLLELIPEEIPDCWEKAISLLAIHGYSARIVGGNLVIRHPALLETLSEIRQMVIQAGFSIGEMKFRETTLEDVFIHLTGRTLRS